MTIHLYFQPNKSVNKNTIALKGLTDSVLVISDMHGVTSIKASNSEDFYFALGYLTAQNRLYSLTKLVAAARGNLSSIFGKKALKADQLILLMGISSEAELALSKLEPDLQQILLQYCNGINRYIDSVSQLQLPSELKRLRAKPIYWNPSDIIACQNLLAIKNQSALFKDLMINSINEYYGGQKVNELIQPIGLSLNLDLDKTSVNQLYELIALTNEIENVFFDFLGNSFNGNNHLVIGGNTKGDKKPKLMVSIHQKTTDPFKGDIYHFEYPGTVVAGLLIPGIPFPMVGRNQAAAWAISSFLEVELINVPTNQYNSNTFLYDGEWHTMVKNEVIIPIKGMENFNFKYRSTDYGSVVSDLINNKSNNIIIMKKDPQVSENSITLLNGIINAGSSRDIVDVVASYYVENLSTLYADTLGNIGIIKRVRDEDRPDKTLIEEIINPRNNFIFTDEIINWIIIDQRNEALAQIMTLANEAEFLTKDEMLNAQQKLDSVYNVVLKDKIIELCSPINDKEIQYAMGELGNWDGAVSTESKGALIFNTTLKYLVVNLYKDELDLLGAELYRAFNNMPGILPAGIWTALHNTNYSWTDNIQTVNEFETIREIITLSLREALKEIREKAGGTHKSNSNLSNTVNVEIIQNRLFDLTEDLTPNHSEMQPTLILIP
jgi:penicillin amidase